MKNTIKKWILLGIICSMLLVQSWSQVSANLTTSEQSVISTYVQKRSVRQTPSTLSTKAIRIQDRITYTLENFDINEFTSDILNYIDTALNIYITTPNTTNTITVTTTTTSNLPSAPHSTQESNDSILSQIQQFEEDREALILAGTQDQVIAEFELTARLENFILENLTLQSEDNTIENSVSQLHLYNEQGIKLWSDRPNSEWKFEFKTLNHKLLQWTTKLYAVVDTMIVGYNWNSQDDSVEFTLRISEWEAKWEFSSTKYAIGNGARSLPITIQSVLVDMIEFVDEWEWARVSTTLTNWANTLAIIKVSTLESSNNEFNAPRDLDTILQTLTVQVSDNTVGNSARDSLVLRRLDRNWSDIQWTTNWSDSVTFTFDADDTASLITNGGSAFFRVEATNVKLTSSQWDSVRLELTQAREALTYMSSDTRSSTFTTNNNQLFLVGAEQVND